jgi:nucleotide-binding universal stress UspA family protein
MRTIIAPVNFTPNSNNAAKYAADMAVAAAADLYLLYVLKLPVSVAEFPLNDYVFNEMQESGAEALQQLQQELEKRTGGEVSVFAHMEIGGVEAKIEEFCKGKHPFAVIMGASGHSLETAVAGSNVTAAVQRLPYPLIVVPEGAAFKKLSKLVLACDLDDMSNDMAASSAFLRELKGLFHSQFEVVNVQTRKQERRLDAVTDVQTWKAYLEETSPDVHVVEMDDVELGIGKYLSDHRADMLVVFPKKHPFFLFHKSQAKRLALHSSVPIMSIHA